VNVANVQPRWWRRVVLILAAPVEVIGYGLWGALLGAAEEAGAACKRVYEVWCE
jgi:hypothetical protein